MPPEHIPSVTQPSQTNPYEFIVSTNHRPASSWLLQSSLKTRIIVFAGGLIALLLIVWIFISLLSSSSASIQNFTSLAQEQAELARISKDPAQNADSETTQSFASTLELSVASDEQTFVGYLTSADAGPSLDTLALKTNKQTDAQLQAAQNSGTYDQTYTSIAQTQLAAYANDLKQAFQATSNQIERQLLNDAYANAQLLLALSKQ